MKHTLFPALVLALCTLVPALYGSPVTFGDTHYDGRTIWLVSHADGCEDCSVVQVWTSNASVTLFRVTITLADGTKLVRSSERHMAEAGLYYGQPSVVVFRGPMAGASIVIASFSQPIDQTN